MQIYICSYCHIQKDTTENEVVCNDVAWEIQIIIYHILLV